MLHQNHMHTHHLGSTSSLWQGTAQLLQWIWHNSELAIALQLLSHTKVVMVSFFSKRSFRSCHIAYAFLCTRESSCPHKPRLFSNAWNQSLNPFLINVVSREALKPGLLEVMSLCYKFAFLSFWFWKRRIHAQLWLAWVFLRSRKINSIVERRVAILSFSIFKYQKCPKIPKFLHNQSGYFCWGPVDFCWGPAPVGPTLVTGSNRVHTSWYYHSIVTMFLSCTISEI